MKRIISLILAVLMVLTVAGCNIGRGNCVAFNVDEEGTFVYKVVRPANGSTTEVVSATRKIRTAIMENMGVKKVAFTDDLTPADEEGYEILVGNTTREASITALERLKENRVNCASDFIVKVIGNTICINAIKDEMLVVAVDWFVENFCASEKAWTKLKKEYEFIYAPEYIKADENTEGNNVYENTVSEADLGTFNIVIPKQTTFLASHFAEDVLSYYKNLGYAPELYRDFEKTGEYEILIGDCDRKESKDLTVEGDNYVIKVIGKKIVVKGGSDLATRTAGEYLVNEIKKAKDGNGFNWADGYTVNGKYDAKETGAYKLTWGDEFKGSKVNYDIWGGYPGYQFDLGGSSLGGKRYRYTGPSNDGDIAALKGIKTPVYVSDGDLVMTYQRFNENDFLCVQLSSYNTMIYRYGYTEIRAKLAPSPATTTLWLNGGKMDTQSFISRFGNEFITNCTTEIDMMENFGSTHEYSANIHTWWTEYDKNGNTVNLGHTSIDGNGMYSGSSSNNKKYIHSDPLTDDYHIYSCYWDEDSYQFAIDGKKFLDYQYKDNKSSSIHRLLMYLLIGGNIANPSYGWSYKKDVHPTYLEGRVDYVRIYQSAAKESQMVLAWPESQETGTRTIVFPENPLTLS